MAVVFDTNNFLIAAPEKPHVSRTDGGHLVVVPKVEVEDRTKLTAPLAIELMKLTMLSGEALRTVMTARGIEIGRINYQDNGNWTPHLHIHIYGRAKGAVLQPYGAPLRFPATRKEFEDTPALEPLHEDDIAEIRTEIEKLLKSEKYRNF